jgi:hypothetical protein
MYMSYTEPQTSARLRSLPTDGWNGFDREKNNSYSTIKFAYTQQNEPHAKALVVAQATDVPLGSFRGVRKRR